LMMLILLAAARLHFGCKPGSHVARDNRKLDTPAYVRIPPRKGLIPDINLAGVSSDSVLHALPHATVRGRRRSQESG
jgi:hypothetical protein